MPKKFVFLLVIVLALFFLEKRASLMDTNSSRVGDGLESPAKETQEIRVFLIALDDNGARGKKVGCGDSAVPFSLEVAPTKAVLKASIDELLSLKEKTYGDGLLYNALATSRLRADTVSISDAGRARIELSGSYNFTGVCEDARFIAQIEETARQFPTVREVEIFLNGRNLDNLYKGN